MLDHEVLPVGPRNVRFTIEYWPLVFVIEVYIAFDPITKCLKVPSESTFELLGVDDF